MARELAGGMAALSRPAARGRQSAVTYEGRSGHRGLDEVSASAWKARECVLGLWGWLGGV